MPGQKRQPQVFSDGRVQSIPKMFSSVVSLIACDHPSLIECCCTVEGTYIYSICSEREREIYRQLCKTLELDLAWHVGLTSLLWYATAGVTNPTGIFESHTGVFWTGLSPLSLYGTRQGSRPQHSER